MKISYIKSFVVAGILVVSAGACKKVLEPELEYAIEASRLKTIVDFERVMNGAYTYMRSSGYYSFAYSTGADVGTDNLIETTSSLGNNRQISQWTYNSATVRIEEAWTAPYQSINQANVVIGVIDNLQETAPGQKNRILGQALAARALGHFNLMRYFAVSYDRNSTELGVAIKTKSEAEFPPRLTVKECYDAIYADLTKAEELLGNVDKPVNGVRKIKIDLNAVRAIRARVSLYAKDYADAKTYTDLVISTSGIALSGITAGTAVNSTTMSDVTSFQSVWFNDLNNTTETIFAVAFNVGQGSPGFFPNDGVNAFSVSADWLALFGGTPTDDVRYNVTFNPSPPVLNGFFRKLSGRFDGTVLPRNGNVDVKAFRIAEMYLIRAEANLNLGADAQARTDIRTLRQNRISGYTPATDAVADVLGSIKLERRKELIGEGHRWFDARRYNDSFSRGSAPGNADCVGTAPDCELLAGDKRFVYPIPLNEIKANPAMANQQNPGW